MTTTIPANTILPLTRIVGTPNAMSVRLLIQESYDRAQAMQTSTQAPFGHLGALMSDATYLALAGNAFDVPVHPGALAALTGTAVNNAEATRVHTAAVAAAVCYQKAMKELSDLIRAALGIQYIAILADPVLGFGNVSPRSILQHVERKYATMTPQEAEDTRATLTATINIDDPLEAVWMNITNVQHAVANIAPITDATAITLTLTAFKETGVYDVDVLEWKRKPEADKTMANFRDHFDAADKERRLNLTVGAAGLHGANAASIVTPTTLDAAARHPVNAGRPMAYCYTHGASVNMRHTSATCNSRCEGHQTAATMDNMMGGCNTIRNPPPPGTGSNHRNRRAQPPAQT
jgi:hypothetical protein